MAGRARYGWGMGWVLAFALSLGAQNAPAPAASTSSPAPAHTVSVPAGERLALELEDSLHTGHNVAGDFAHFTTIREVVLGYETVIPAGSSVRATLTEVKKPGRRGRPGEISLQFDEIVLSDGTTLPLAARVVNAGFANIGQGRQGVRVKGEGGLSGRDVLTVAVGAGQGALIGATIGGGKGAGYGGAIGAGIGLMEILLRKGPHLDLPRGMLFEVELEKDLGIPQDSVARFNSGGAQLASLPPASNSSTSNSSSTSSWSASTDDPFRFPDDPDAVPAPDEPVPDFPESEPTATEEGTTVASNREPLPTPGAPTDLPPAPPAVGPPPPPPDIGDQEAYKLRVDVRLVMVEAFVRDQHGRPMDDLKKEDFRLWEDGAEQKITHFSRDELPLAVALVVDRSGSVAPFMPELRRAAYETLSQLKQGDEVALFSFDSEVDRLEELTTDRRRIAERIARIRAGGGTNISDALAEATHYLALAARDRRRIIILISDNQETTRGHTGQGTVIRRALETEVVIYSVKTPGEPTPLTMRIPNWLGGGTSVRRVTEETGGEIIDVDRVGSLRAALAAVVSRLKTRYTLGYSSSNKQRDGAFRRIEVHLTDRYGRPERDYSVYARRGYYAPDERLAARPADSQ